MEALQDINDALVDTMLDWVQHFIEQRRAALMRGKKGVATGALRDSFRFDIERTAREEGIALLIAFNEEGRFLDMKPSSFEHDVWGRNAISRLEAWVQKRGIGFFLAGYLDKYPNTGSRTGSFNLNRVIRNIAWGIAINRSNGKFKRGKKFWNASKTAGTYDLINQAAVALPAPTLDTLKKQFDGKRYAKAKGR